MYLLPLDIQSSCFSKSTIPTSLMTDVRLGKMPRDLVRLLIWLFRFARGLFVRIFRQCSVGNRV
jgi:hypothetical protein